MRTRRLQVRAPRRAARRSLRERLESFAVFCAIVPVLWIVFDPPESWIEDPLRVTQARTETHRIASYACLFWQKNGRWPLESELFSMPVVDGPRLPSVGPWGAPYRLEIVDGGARCRVRCDGEDGERDSWDDVVSQPFAHGALRVQKGSG